MFGWSEHVGMIVTWIILTGDLDNDCDFCKYVFISEDCRIGCGPLPVTLTTSIITFLVYRGFQPKPSFVTIASWGPQPTHYQSRTVDGRNLANRLTGSSSRSLQIFTGFFFIPGGCFGFLPSTVSVQNQLLWLLQLSVFSTENLFLKTSGRGSGFYDANGAVWDRNTYCLRFDDAILEGYESQIASGNTGNNTHVFLAFLQFLPCVAMVARWSLFCQDMFCERLFGQYYKLKSNFSTYESLKVEIPSNFEMFGFQQLGVLKRSVSNPSQRSLRGFPKN